MMPNIAKQTPAARTRSVEISERTAKAIELRRLGLSYSAIGESLGIATSRAHDLVKAGLRAHVAGPVDQYRDAELRNLENLERQAQKILDSFHHVVSAGAVVTKDYVDLEGNPVIDPRTQKPYQIPLSNPKPALDALKILVAISESRRKLTGADAPAQQAVQVTVAPGSGAAIALDPRGLAEVRAILDAQRARDMGAIEVIPRTKGTESGDRNVAVPGESDG